MRETRKQSIHSQLAIQTYIAKTVSVLSIRKIEYLDSYRLLEKEIKPKKYEVNQLCPLVQVQDKVKQTQ